MMKMKRHVGPFPSIQHLVCGTLPLLLCAGLLMIQPAEAALVVFNAGFEYGGTAPAVDNDAANLNSGMVGLVGTFSGAAPDTSEAVGQLMTFVDGPGGSGDKTLLVDRPVTDGILTANLTSIIPVAGATVSFDMATRRTSGGRNKDYDIVGFDDANNESFHLHVIADSDGDPPSLSPDSRLATITGGGTEDFQLISTWGGTGSDGDEDLPYTAPGLTSSKLASIVLSLGTTGYTIDFSRNNISYTTGLVSYNGMASTLSRVEFQYQDQTGFYLDNLVISSVPEPSTFGVLGLFGGIGLVLFYRKRRGGKRAGKA